jgi:hypothetical protein
MVYKTYNQAGDWMAQDPDDAGRILSQATDISAHVTRKLIASGRISLHVRPAADLQREFMAVYQAGIKTGFLEKPPDDGTFYENLKA